MSTRHTLILWNMVDFTLPLPCHRILHKCAVRFANNSRVSCSALRRKKLTKFIFVKGQQFRFRRRRRNDAALYCRRRRQENVNRKQQRNDNGLAELDQYYFPFPVRLSHGNTGVRPQWCTQDQILKNKTKTKTTKPRPRPPEVNKVTWRI